jgi:hypothetical protein
MAASAQAFKILDATQPHLERAGAPEWLRRFIKIEVLHLRSLFREADAAIIKGDTNAPRLADTATNDFRA